jgi:hypothetical protein
MGRRSLDPPLYWRSPGADSPLNLSRGLPPGHAFPQVFRTQGAKGCSQRIGPISQRRYGTADRLARKGYRGVGPEAKPPGAICRHGREFHQHRVDESIDIGECILRGRRSLGECEGGAHMRLVRWLLRGPQT